ncbi:type I restriction-modification system subunit M N-terminal domain-containing protein [uncultured Ferrovibrio sp.]|uniref:type I restriction-modification system subunit M N-terminal domain-containing protein n=1 Tax=uncultured Ferrovibrio sp. TaxID=1576913 RepID=UPI003413973B
MRASCDALRGGMDASQYKDYVLSLLFIKYISDKYAGEPYARLLWRTDQEKVAVLSCRRSRETRICCGAARNSRPIWSKTSSPVPPRRA